MSTRVPPSRLGFNLGGRREDRRVLAAAAALALLLSVVWTLLSYLSSPLLATAFFGGIALFVAIARHPMAGVYAGLLSIPLERFELSFGGEADVTPTAVLFLITGGIAAVHLLASARKQELSLAYLAFGSMLVVTALGLLVTPNGLVTLQILVQWAAYLAISMYVAQTGEEQIRRVIGCLAFSGGVLGAISLLTARPQQVLEGGQAATNRAEASFQHPAVLAFFLILALPPTLALAFKGRALLRPVLIGAAALCTAGIILSLTRGAILGATAALLVLLFWPPFRRTIAVLLVGVALYAAFNYETLEQSPQLRVLGERLQTITQLQGSRQNQRVYIWSETPRVIIENPFLGVGAGAYGEVTPTYGIVGPGGRSFAHAHNLFLTIAAEQGLIALALFVAFFAVVAATGVRFITRHSRSPLFPYGLAFTAALAGFFVSSIPDYPPDTLVVMAVFMIVVGALIAIDRQIRARKGERRAAGRRAPPTRS